MYCQYFVPVLRLLFHFSWWFPLLCRFLVCYGPIYLFLLLLPWLWVSSSKKLLPVSVSSGFPPMFSSKSFMNLYLSHKWHPTPVLLPGKSHGWRSDFTFTFHFHALEKEMATNSSVLAWRIPGTGEPGGLLSLGLHRVGHDWCDLAAVAAAFNFAYLFFLSFLSS